MFRVDAPTITTGVINGPPFGNLLPSGLLIDVPMGVDGGVATAARNLFHSITFAHSTRPEDALVCVQADGFQPGSQLKVHTNIVARRYSCLKR